MTIPYRQDEIQHWVTAKLAERLNVPSDSIDGTAPLSAFGLNSMEAIMLTGECERWLEIELPPTLLFDHATVEKLSTRLAELVGGAGATRRSSLPPRG